MPIQDYADGYPFDQKDGKVKWSTVQTSTNAEVTVLLVKFLYYKKLLINMYNDVSLGAGGTVTVKIYGSNYDFPVAVETSSGMGTLLKTITLVASAQDYETLTDAWEIVYVTIQSLVAGTPGNVDLTAVLKR
jgi:hypothetical protein